MGQHADDILNGDVDEQTGEWLGDGMGFPRSKNIEQKNKIKNEIPDCLSKVQKTLMDNGYTLTVIKPIGYGVYMKTASGAVVNVYTSGRITIQGKPDEKLNSLFK